MGDTRDVSTLQRIGRHFFLVLPAGSAVCRRLTTRPGEADHKQRPVPLLATS
jgi:hypothetical protein